MRVRRALSLRNKFLLIVLAGAVVPLALVGLWLASTAARSGEELLRARLDESLAQIVQDIGTRWVARRSDLLELAENDFVQRGLRQSRPTGQPSEDDEALGSLRVAYTRMQQAVESAVLRETSGTARWTLAPQSAEGVGSLPGFSTAASAGPPLTVQLGIYDNLSGDRLGTLDARLRMSSLVPAAAGWAGGIGSVLAIFDRATGASLLAGPFDPALFERDRFEWAGELWLTERRSLDEPGITLVAAAPLAPYAEPFQQAARRGALALVGVVLLGLIVTTLLTRRVTHSLEQLAGAAEAVSRGDLGRQVEEGRGDEVGRVARAFNAMTRSLRRTLDELAQGQALAAVGRFASSLAHEVRNPLTSIRVDLQRTQEQLPGPAAIREPLARALREIKRLDQTVTGALRVARSGQIVREPVDIRVPLSAALQAARAEFHGRGASVELVPRATDADEGVWLKGDESALEQLFLNLLLNAAQALETGGRARVTIDATPRDIVVAIVDTGHGMAPDVLERVFEPFYSTKSEGTGLGLAIAQRIAAAHGGAIELSSAPGAETTVRVRLPRGSELRGPA